MTLIAEELTKMSSLEFFSPQIEIRTDPWRNDQIDQFDKSKLTPQNVRFHHQKVQFDRPEASFERAQIQMTETSDVSVNPFWLVNLKFFFFFFWWWWGGGHFQANHCDHLLLHFLTTNIAILLTMFCQFMGN
jgi:hypothetical protein